MAALGDKPASTILFVGYQANGTLGRAIYEGAKEVRLFGETIEVKAKIDKFIGISGHADKDGLLRWVDSFAKKPQKVFVVHGEDSVTENFASLLRNEYCLNAIAPYTGSVYDLADGGLITEGSHVRVERASKPHIWRARVSRSPGSRQRGWSIPAARGCALSGV